MFALRNWNECRNAERNEHILEVVYSFLEMKSFLKMK